MKIGKNIFLYCLLINYSKYFILLLFTIKKKIFFLKNNGNICSLKLSSVLYITTVPYCLAVGIYKSLSSSELVFQVCYTYTGYTHTLFTHTHTPVTHLRTSHSARQYQPSKLVTHTCYASRHNLLRTSGLAIEASDRRALASVQLMSYIQILGPSGSRYT